MTRYDYATVAEAARRTRHSEQSVRRWLREGRLDGRRVAGGRWLIRTTDLDRLLRKEAEPDGVR